MPRGAGRLWDRARNKLLRDALIDVAPKAHEAVVSVDGWTCVFTYKGAGAWGETWFEHNSVGERVQRQETDVPLSIICKVIAAFYIKHIAV